MKRAVLATVKTRDDAEAVVDALRRNGVDPQDISVLFAGRKDTNVFARATHTNAPNRHGGGVAAAGMIAGTLGLATAIALAPIPGVQILAIGPILGSLAGFAVAGLGGLTGAVRGFGVDEDEARSYVDKLRGGHVVIGVHSDDIDARARAAQIFRDAGADDISSIGAEHVLYDART
jgi:hypothetical protein